MWVPTLRLLWLPLTAHQATHVQSRIRSVVFFSFLGVVIAATVLAADPCYLSFILVSCTIYSFVLLLSVRSLYLFIHRYLLHHLLALSHAPSVDLIPLFC